MASQISFEAILAMKHELCSPNNCRLAEYLEHGLLAIKAKLEIATPGHTGYHNALNQYVALARLLGDDENDITWQDCMSAGEQGYLVKWFLDILMEHGQDVLMEHGQAYFDDVCRDVGNALHKMCGLEDYVLQYEDWEQLPEGDLEDVPTPGDMGCVLAVTLDSIPRDSECVICQESLPSCLEGDRVVELPTCHHCFHHDCLATWFQSKNTCPLCRASVEMANQEQHQEPAEFEPLLRSLALMQDDVLELLGVDEVEFEQMSNHEIARRFLQD